MANFTTILSIIPKGTFMRTIHQVRALRWSSAKQQDIELKSCHLREGAANHLSPSRSISHQTRQTPPLCAAPHRPAAHHRLCPILLEQNGARANNEQRNAMIVAR